MKFHDLELLATEHIIAIASLQTHQSTHWSSTIAQEALRTNIQLHRDEIHIHPDVKFRAFLSKILNNFTDCAQRNGNRNHLTIPHHLVRLDHRWYHGMHLEKRVRIRINLSIDFDSLTKDIWATKS